MTQPCDVNNKLMLFQVSPSTVMAPGGEYCLPKHPKVFWEIIRSAALICDKATRALIRDPGHLLAGDLLRRHPFAFGEPQCACVDRYGKLQHQRIQKRAQCPDTDRYQDLMIGR